MKTIYLSHSWKFRKTGKILQKKLEDLGYKVYNPFSYKQNWKPETIVKRDLKLINKSDFMVAYYGIVSIGVTMEIFYAGGILKKPVYLLCTPAKDQDALEAVYGDVYIKKLTEHCWLQNCVTEFFNNTKDLLDYLRKEYNNE